MEPTDQEKAPPIHSGLLGRFTGVHSSELGSNSLHSHWARRGMETSSLSPTPAYLPHSLPPPNRLPTRSGKRVNLSKLGRFTGFRFKQDLVYLSSTFCSQGCNSGFDGVEPFIDITCIYNYLQQSKQLGRKVPKQTKSLAAICKEVLGISLSKELQCSDWSQRPLTKEQKTYAAADAHCLLDIFKVFRAKVVREGNSFRNYNKNWSSNFDLGLKQIFETPNSHNLAVMDSPKFLCDVMVEGLAKHLRCVGIDAAIPYSKKPETRDLIDQAAKEKRVLLTRDAKILRHEYLIKNQIYRVKSLLKNEQLLEVIETFQLKISEDRLMSRCTKCNGKFIQKPLTTEEAVEAAKGFQVIPNCLFNKNIEFWQCMDCNQLYWEGTQYHNAVQKFIDVCKLNE
ncbi:3'-5' exonuclease domain-containing protein [Forsythia ovata]|uniref:3'-5' exonuclease domain-containing protein n=1 Tax=Forsythia ovata TaxID=205694 RepID=A0ABD1WM95_9LAMI